MVELYLDTHGEILTIVIFYGQKSVIFLLVEILKRHEDKQTGYLGGVMGTMIATRVKIPPVVDVSSWSVCIFLKKSNGLSISKLYRIISKVN